MTWARSLHSKDSREARDQVSRFSPKLLENFTDPQDFGELPGATHVGRGGVPGVGAFLVIYLRVMGEVCEEARFQGAGCGVTIACGSVLTQLVTGKAVKELALIDARAISDALDGLPADKAYCAAIAASALQMALSSESHCNLHSEDIPSAN